MILTAADSSHFRPLLNLLACCERHEPAQRAVVYDLGLTDEERALVRAEVRRFPFERFPAHSHVRDLKVYAWKPIVILDALADGESVMWHDAGNLFWRPLDAIWALIETHGFFMPPAHGSIGERCMAETARAMGAKVFMCAPMRAGSLIGISPRRADLAAEAVEYALSRDVIAPLGHNRHIHLYDQPIFSILAERAGIAPGPWCSVTRGNDNLTAEQARACLDSERPW